MARANYPFATPQDMAKRSDSRRTMTDSGKTDVSVGRDARNLIRSLDRAALATLRSQSGGWPYASLVMVACGHDASPVLLISGLAEHTRNIGTDDRVSLLYDGTIGLADPLTGARVSVQGNAKKTSDAGIADRFLRRHPSAQAYAGFGDFSFWRVEIESAHLVAGFGRIHWIGAEAIRFDTTGCEALATAEDDILNHMNEDHSDAVALFAQSLAGRRQGEWQMTGIDPEGCDLRLDGESVRIAFETTIGDPESARRELVRLTRQARQAAAG